MQATTLTLKQILNLCQKRKRAADMGADVCRPRNASGRLPADDLVLRQDFMSRIEKALQDIAELSADSGPQIKRATQECWPIIQQCVSDC